jgi:hypothetical protein
METDSVILASIGSIIAYLGAQKWIFPLIGKFWCWIKGEKRDFDKKNFDGSKALVDYKKTVIETQEQQFQVLLNQITALEVELQKYSNELQTLRNTIFRSGLSAISRFLTTRAVLVWSDLKACHREERKS